MSTVNLNVWFILPHGNFDEDDDLTCSVDPAREMDALLEELLPGAPLVENALLPLYIKRENSTKIKQCNYNRLLLYNIIASQIINRNECE
jgi:hypothetical protein